MNRYIAIEGYPDQFFRVAEKVTDIEDNLEDIMQKRIVNATGQSVLHGGSKRGDDWTRFQFATMFKPDYKGSIRKYGTILIREIGSYMFLSKDHVITKEIMSNSFPRPNQNSKIVVCENDMNAEKEWIDYLRKRFPNESIDVINYFSSRSEQEISEAFKNSEFITFSTTFTSMDWFRKLVKSKHNHNKIIGYSHSNESWYDVDMEFGDIGIEKILTIP